MIVNNSSVSIVVPTYNAGEEFKNFIKSVLQQEELKPEDVLVIDSSSSDGTAVLAREAGFMVRGIPRNDFSHGGTRAWAVENVASDVVVFLTQDAILAETDALKKLLLSFSDESVAAVYGRQLPHTDTSAFGAHARVFNYGATSFTNSLEDKGSKGLKAAFFSDSFSAYRRSALLAVGNFDHDLQYGEDTIAAARLLLAGYKTAYCAEACVYHAHSYSVVEEFKRYYATGKFHKEQSWLLASFGKAEGEGLRFVLSELRFLCQQGKWYLAPWAFVRNGAKYVGYWLGKNT